MDNQKEFIQVLAAVMGVKSQEQFESGIKALGEDGLKTMYETYKQVKNLGEEGLKQLKTTYSKIMTNKETDNTKMEAQNITSAKLGAKLNYIKQLRGECPEGYEIEKYLAGGCVACRKKMKEGASVVERFKSEKCGGKMKKKVTKASGGNKIPKKNRVTERSYIDDDRQEVVTVRTYNGRTFEKRDDMDGAGSMYKGYNGKRSAVPAGEKPDSLARAWERNAEAKPKGKKNLKKCGGKMKKVKKNYFGGILDKWL